MIIRDAKESDLEAFFELWYASELEHATYNPLDEIKPKEKIRDIVINGQWMQMADKNNVFLVAEMPTKAIVGFAIGHVGQREDMPILTIDKEGFIDEICVAEKFRKMGVGKKLFDALMERLYVKGAPFIGLAVSVGNSAVGFYQKQGFQIKSYWMTRSEIPLKKKDCFGHYDDGDTECSDCKDGDACLAKGAI
jgi:ribosomal protein S18 acetylase RimI-like enzyme